ncbi:MAG: PadR family transcriptional regulator [Nanoarchaeota archaeon]
MVKIAEKVISYNLGKNVLFDKIDYGENVLVLYQDTSNHQQVLRNFLKQFSDSNSLLFYVSHRTNEILFNFDVQNFSFNVVNDDIIHKLKSKLNECFDKMEKAGCNLFLVCDWSKADLSNCEIFLPFLESLVKKSRGITPSGWKRTYRAVKQKTPFILINAFETTTLSEDFIHQLLPLHQRAYLMQENFNTFLLPTISPSLQTIFPKSHVLPQETLEKLTKDNLELISLLLLEREDKSGYQILKDIAGHFQCILSQGTLYPLLYRLEKKGKIVKQNGKGREVIYSLSPKTKNELQPRKETMIRAYQHLASFFKMGGGRW